MYTGNINGVDMGETTSVKAMKTRIEKISGTFSGSIWAEIYHGKKLYAFSDNGKNWERYISLDEIRKIERKKAVSACKAEILESAWTIPEHERIRQKYGEEVFDAAIHAA